MNRLQFWIFNLSCVVIVALVATDLIIANQVEKRSRDLAVLRKTVEERPELYQRNQQIATRVYQLSGQDAALKQLMVRQQITVMNPTTPATNSPPNSP